MRVLSFFVVAGAAAIALGACGDGRGYGSLQDNEIVFGITQDQTVDGKVTTSAGWEMLSLGYSGWSVISRRNHDRQCYLEALARRVGTPFVESGTASFLGAAIPNGGLTITSTSPDGEAKSDGAAWKTGDTLTFVSHGFAIPDVPSVSLLAPTTVLAITAPDAADMTFDGTTDVTVTWTPDTTDPGTELDDVMVAFTADDGNAPVEVRCFFERKGGTGTVPHELLSNLAPPGQSTKGQVRIGTHSQVTLFDGDWVVYVVAGVLHRAQSFSLTR
jgi:hypothetical protein